MLSVNNTPPFQPCYLEALHYTDLVYSAIAVLAPVVLSFCSSEPKFTFDSWRLSSPLISSHIALF